MNATTVIIFLAVLRSLATVASIAGAVYLAANNHDGWGWLIFLAICLELGTASYASAITAQNPEK